MAEPPPFAALPEVHPRDDRGARRSGGDDEPDERPDESGARDPHAAPEPRTPSDGLRHLVQPALTWRSRIEQATGGALAWPSIGSVVRGRPRALVAVVVVAGLALGAGAALIGAGALGGGDRDVAVDLPMAARSSTSTARGPSGAAAGPDVGAGAPTATAGASGTGSSQAGAGAAGPASGATGSGEDIVVAAAGAVARPGVYRVGRGARVGDVVAAAGGLDPSADPDRLNLAAPVQDGERVYVPRRGQPDVPPVDTGGGAAPGAGPPGGGGGSSGGPATTVAALVDLNRADVALLDTLPGVGPSTAAAIVAYRTSKGRFASVDELGEVRGIGPAKLEQLRPLVRVG